MATDHLSLCAVPGISKYVAGITQPTTLKIRVTILFAETAHAQAGLQVNTGASPQHGQQFATSGWMLGRYRYFLLLRKSQHQPDRPLAAERPNTGKSTRTDWSTIKCQETFEVCLFVDVSFSSRKNHRARDAYGVFKADVLRESKNSAWFPSSEMDDRSWPLSVIVRLLRGRVRLGKGEE